jgi:hypothetical protein
MTLSTDNIPCEICHFDPTLAVIYEWEFDIDFTWLSVNKVGINSSGRKGHTYRKYRKAFLAALDRDAEGVPPAKVFRRIFVTRCYVKPCYRYDDDNLRGGFKPLRDCFTTSGLILDDNKAGCQFIYCPQEAGPTTCIRVRIQELKETT